MGHTPQTFLPDGLLDSVAPPPPGAPGRPPVHTPARPELTEIAAMTSNFAQSHALHRLIEPLSARDIEALVVESARVFTSTDYASASAIMLTRLAELDPWAALSLAEAGAPGERRAWLHAVFHVWARLDPGAAREAAGSLSLGNRRIAGSAILMARSDWSLAERREITDTLGTELVMSQTGNFEQAWEVAMQEDVTDVRLQKLSSIAYQWSMVDPRAAIAAVETVPQDNRYAQSLLPAVISGWARQEPQAALEWFLDREWNRQSRYLLRTIFSHLVEDNLDSALTVAGGLPEERQAHAMSAVLPVWAENDLNAATDWVLSQSTDGVRAEHLKAISVGMKSDINLMRSWYDSLPPADAEPLLASLIGTFAGDDALDAALRVERIEGEQLRRRAGSNLLKQWVKDDPEAAAGWVLQQEGANRRAWNGVLVQRWIRTDPEAARGFALAQPRGEDRDNMVVSLIARAPLDEAELLVAELAGDDARQQVEQILERKRTAGDEQLRYDTLRR